MKIESKYSIGDLVITKQGSIVQINSINYKKFVNYETGKEEDTFVISYGAIGSAYVHPEESILGKPAIEK